jgi:hypothetical protein
MRTSLNYGISALALRAPEGVGSQPVEESADARKKIADRDWIDDSGNVVDEEVATGVRYTFLGRTKEGVTIPPDGKSYTLYMRDLKPEALNMLAGFGAITLMGNVTNTWMGDKGDTRAALAADAIAERIDLLNSGKWIDRTGGVGARVDKDALAQAVVEVGAANGKTADLAVVREKLEQSADFMKAVRSNAEINAAYARIVGRQTATVDDIFGNLAA